MRLLLSLLSSLFICSTSLYSHASGEVTDEDTVILPGAEVMNQSLPMGEHFPELATFVGGRQYHAYIREFDKLTDMKKSGFKTLSQYCNALYWTGDYGKSLRCIRTFRKRLMNYSAADQQSSFSFFGGGPSVNYHVLAQELHSLYSWYYIAIGNYSKAIEHGKEMARILEQYNRGFSWMLANLGIAQALAGDGQAARATIERIKTNQKHAGVMVRSFAANDINDAPLYVMMALKDYAGIKDTLGEIGNIETLWQNDDYVQGEKFARGFMQGKIAFATGELDTAMQIYDKLIRDSLAPSQPNLLYTIYHDSGRISERNGQTDVAIDYYIRAIDIIEQQRASFNSDGAKIGFVGDKQDVYRDLIILLVRNGEFQKAFEYVERAKSRSLMDLLAGKSDLQPTGNNASSLLSELSAAESALNAATSEGTTDQYQARKSRATELKQKITSEHPELASLVSVNPANLSDVQGLLSKDEALLEYYYQGKELITFVIKKNSITARRADEPDLVKNITAFRKEINAASGIGYKKLSQLLYKQIIEPVRKELSVKRVLVVAHGAMHYLPFNALSDKKNYLIDQYTLRSLPSASVMQFLTARKENPKRSLLILANPDLGDPQYDLPGAQLEGKLIANGIANTRLLLRKQATETAVKNNGADYRLLHFASHGVFDAGDPLNSSLLLASDGENDGRLTVSEMYELKLNAELVTLSACETALGETMSGDDVIGFTRGMLYAGARSIVSSLWEVDDDATKMLMTRFYNHLKTKPKVEALRLAQLETRKKYIHPVYWAAFQLIGNAN